MLEAKLRMTYGMESRRQCIGGYANTGLASDTISTCCCCCFLAGCPLTVAFDGLSHWMRAKRRVTTGLRATTILPVTGSLLRAFHLAVRLAELLRSPPNSLWGTCSSGMLRRKG